MANKKSNFNIDNCKKFMNIKDTDGWQLQPSQCHLKYSKTKIPSYIFCNYYDVFTGPIKIFNAVTVEGRIMQSISLEGIEIKYNNEK